MYAIFIFLFQQLYQFCNSQLKFLNFHFLKFIFTILFILQKAQIYHQSLYHKL